MPQTQPHGDAGGLADNQTLGLCLDDPQRCRELMERMLTQPVLAFESLDLAKDESAAAHGGPQHGHRRAYIVANDDLVKQVLSSPAVFGNAPYAAIGSGGFMLALDPAGHGEADEHARQRHYAEHLVHGSAGGVLRTLAVAAVRQGAVAGLQQDRFDLAVLSEQIAVRFCSLWFGFAAQDFPLLQAAAAAGYRALVYQIVGRHFLPDVTVLAQTKQAMALLHKRAAELLAVYFKIDAQRQRREAGAEPEAADAQDAADAWPEGVTPPALAGLPDDFAPLLLAMVRQPADFSVQELASIAVGMVLGTVGNVQASVCLVMQQLLDGDAGPAREAAGQDGEQLQQLVARALARTPPVPFLPRHVKQPTQLGDVSIEAGADVLVWLGAIAARQECPFQGALAFGGTTDGHAQEKPAWPHACPGTEPGLVLVTEAVRMLLQLPGLALVMDPRTRRTGLTQHWGFACERFPLTHKRLDRVRQQPLNVIMRVRTPVEVHGEALRQFLRIGAPRIEQALHAAGIVHFAWFEFLDQGRQLALRTVYDGDFDAYVKLFAQTVADVFDRLFEHLEGGPRRPVAEDPDGFVEVVRAHNGAPAEGYFYSAYPQGDTARILDLLRKDEA